MYPIIHSLFLIASNLQNLYICSGGHLFFLGEAFARPVKNLIP